MVQHWKRTPSFHPFIQSRSVRIMVLFVIVLTIVPINMVDDYHYLFKCNEGVSLDTGIPELAGEYSCDSHHDCSCFLCNATTGHTYKIVISAERYPWDSALMTFDSLSSLFPIKVYHPPRA